MQYKYKHVYNINQIILVLFISIIEYFKQEIP